MVNMREDCQFLKDVNGAENFGGMSKGLWNLAVCKGQVKLFSKGIKPTKNWRLKDVKNYFGLSGGTNKVLAQLTQLQAIITGKYIISHKDINLTNERS